MSDNAREASETMTNSHLINGEFQSDKYPTTPRGKVPLSCKDRSAQDLLWEYAQRRRAIDNEFSDALEAALRTAGFAPTPPAPARPDARKAAEDIEAETSQDDWVGSGDALADKIVLAVQKSVDPSLASTVVHLLLKPIRDNLSAATRRNGTIDLLERRVEELQAAPSPTPANPAASGLSKDEQITLKRLEDLRSCDPECEGRCTFCPDMVGREAAAIIRRLASPTPEGEKL